MGSSGFLLIIIAFGFLYFVLVRPQKRRQADQARLLGNLDVGDEVVTAGGIYGQIRSIDGDDLMVEIAPELEVRIARRAIGGVVKAEHDEPADAEPEAVDGEPEETETAPEQSPDPPIAEDDG